MCSMFETEWIWFRPVLYRQKIFLQRLVDSCEGKLVVQLDLCTCSKLYLEHATHHLVLCVFLSVLLFLVQKVEALESRLLSSPVHKNPQLEKLYNLCQKKADVRCWLNHCGCHC